MKFRLVENINSGLENEPAMGVLDEELGVRLYLGQNGSKMGGLFTATGKLLKQLWDDDDEHYEDINHFLSKLEYLLDVPDLDYKNNRYNFAFKKGAITPEIREIIDDLDYYLNELDYEVIEETIETDNIEYEDNIQFAYKPLDEEILNEDQWYRVDINPSINISGTNYNDIYVWAKNGLSGAGPHQITDIVDSARAGYYTGRNKEQSFNRPVADEIKFNGCTVTNVTPTTTNPIGMNNVLSRTDRGMRKEAHKAFTNAVITYIKTNHPQTHKAISGNDFLIHHHNLGRKEYENNLNDLMIIPYNNRLQLDLAHIGHKLIHTITGNCSTGLSHGTYNLEIHDLSTTPATIYPVTITL